MTWLGHASAPATRPLLRPPALTSWKIRSPCSGPQGRGAWYEMGLRPPDQGQKDLPEVSHELGAGRPGVWGPGFLGLAGCLGALTPGSERKGHWRPRFQGPGEEGSRGLDSSL